MKTMHKYYIITASALSLMINTPLLSSNIAEGESNNNSMRSLHATETLKKSDLIKKAPNQTIVISSPFLDWEKRPESINLNISRIFKNIESSNSSSWNLYNGHCDYHILGISQLKLAWKLLQDAHKDGRKEVYFLDSGAGNFQSCDAFADYFNERKKQLPKGITINIIGTRGESYIGNEIETKGICKVYKFGGFKIEEHQRELKKKGLDLNGKIDLLISNWANRHLVDPMGTWTQFFNTIRCKTGILLMDWFYSSYEGESIRDKTEAFAASRLHLIDLLMYLKEPFLLQLHGDGYTRDTDRFLIKKTSEKSLHLPLAYVGGQSIDRHYFDIGSGWITRFKVLDQTYTGNRLILNDDLYKKNISTTQALWGDKELYTWALDNEMVDLHAMRFGAFRQFFQVDLKRPAIVSLDFDADFQKKIQESASKLETQEERIIQRNKKIEENKSIFKASLKMLLPPEIPATSEGIANMATQKEHMLFSALSRNNFEEAAKLIKEGAKLNRLFQYGSGRETLLGMAIMGEFSKNESFFDRGSNGIIQFLISNGADPKTESLDSAIYFYRTPKEIKLLIEKGIEIRDPNLALYRSIQRELKAAFELVDLFLSKGAEINGFINGLPMIYGSQSNIMWNYLIDKGARGSHGQELKKREI